MKVLIVGLGSIAQKHIDSLLQLLGNLEIFALRRSESKIDYDGIINIYELEGDFDFAIVSNPTSEHAFTISNLLKLKIPLFIEKPLFGELKYDKLIETINFYDIKTYIACNLRFLDSINYLKSHIDGKRINEINIYCGSYLPEWRPNVNFRDIYSAQKELGGGVHIDLIHEIDYVVYLFGFPNLIHKTFRSNSSLDISAYDYANYLFEYDGFCVNIILNYYRRSPKRSIEIVCEDGEYRADLLKNKVFWNEEVVFSSNQKISDTYLPQMKYFLENIIKNSSTKSLNNINEAYNILKLCLED